VQLFRNLFSELNYGNVKLHFLSNTQLLVFVYLRTAQRTVTYLWRQ